jgi:choline dehydrogenase
MTTALLTTQLFIGPLGAGQQITVLHKLHTGGLPAKPNIIMPDRCTPIGVIAFDDLSITFENFGPPDSAQFFVELEHTFQRDKASTAEQIWKGDQGQTLFADYVIVGNGTAGAALARYLTDDMVTSVVVIESGANYITGGTPADRAPVAVGAPLGDLSLPLDTKYSFFRPMRTGLAQSGFFGFGDSEGRMWGGGSAHNNMLTVRSSADVYDKWATDSGNAQWTYDNLLSLMKFMENYIPNGTVADPAQRGSGGPLTISQDQPIAGGGSDAGIALLAAAIATASNAPLETDYNVKTNPASTAAMQWFSTAPGTSFNGNRVSAGAFLPLSVVSAAGHGVGARKLTIISDANALNLLTTGGPSPDCVGVKYFKNSNQDSTLFAIASKKTIVCAGAVATPAILQRSGIGDPALLTPLGIPVVVNNPNVGANLKNHYGCSGVIPIGEGTPPGLFQGIIANIDLSGTIAHPTGQANDGVRRYQLLVFPGNAFFLQPAVLVALGQLATPAIAFVGALLIPRAVGKVEIASADPLVDPRINVDCYEDVIAPTDLDRGVQALKVIANISLAYSGAMPIWPPAAHYPVSWPGGAALNDSALVQDLEQIPFQSYHLVGSCRMAINAAAGVVDANLDVFGISRLACCDNSVIPQITTGNTSYPAYLLGLKKAQLEGALIP